MERHIDINSFDYPLPDERIAKFPLENRTDSKLMVYRNGDISESRFRNLAEHLPKCSMLVFNNTRVIRARVIMHKPSGARIEVFCLEPHNPADYERAFAARESCEWSCIVGNIKKWKEGYVEINFTLAEAEYHLRAWISERGEREHIIRFEWNAPLSFGEVLEELGRIPIPPYLNRESEEIDLTRYQTVYSKVEGSVAAPTAGLHFASDMIAQMKEDGFCFDEVTLHVGAGTFLPVKSENAAQHPMHTEHFEVQLSTLENLLTHIGNVTAVGTTSVRTLESLPVLGWRIRQSGSPATDKVVGQWESYDIPSDYSGREVLEDVIGYMRREGLTSMKAATQIMITPLGFRFRIVSRIITNFHQPKSTLLLLISAYVGEDWRKMYQFALDNGFRFLSYGDSSLLICDK